MTYAADFEKSLQVDDPQRQGAFPALAGADRQRKVVDRAMKARGRPSPWPPTAATSS